MSAIYTNDQMSNEEYHSRAELSSTTIKRLLKNPYKVAAGITDEPSRAMITGQALHCLVLEREKFYGQFAIEPQADGRTKEGKAIKAEFAASANCKTIITAAEYETIASMTETIAASPASVFFKNAASEVSVIGEIVGEEGKKYPARARFDYAHETGVIVDLKQSADASPSGFARAAANLDYAVQAAWYMDAAKSAGLDYRQFVFVAIEPNPPYMVGVYDLTDWIELGREHYRRALEIYDRLDEYREPLYRALSGEIVQKLAIPQWLFYK